MYDILLAPVVMTMGLESPKYMSRRVEAVDSLHSFFLRTSNFRTEPQHS